MTVVQRTIEVWADTRGEATCRGADCGALIVWAEVVKSGRKMCFNRPAVALRTRHDQATHRLIEEIDFTENHWATCPNAPGFRTVDSDRRSSRR